MDAIAGAPSEDGMVSVSLVATDSRCEARVDVERKKTVYG